MSWDADLHCDACGHWAANFSYTHNTNDMIAAALVAVGEPEPEMCGGLLGPAIGPVWWKRLDGLSGPEGAAFIDTVLRGLGADPARFRAMNPSNGWGSYDGLVEVLTEMRDAVPEYPTTWRTSG